MKSMAVAKSDMGILSREQLTQATFGALCQSFAVQILCRSGYEDGLYQRVALEFLEEAPQESRQPVNNIFNIDLSLMLETIRKESQEQKRAKKETEKLLEQVIQIQQAAEQKDSGAERTSTVERYYFLPQQHTTITQQNIVLHNRFHNHATVFGSGDASSRQATRHSGRTGLEQTMRLRSGEKKTKKQAQNPSVPAPAPPGSRIGPTAPLGKPVQEGRQLAQPPAQSPAEPSGGQWQPASDFSHDAQPFGEVTLKTEPDTTQTQHSGEAAAQAAAQTIAKAAQSQLQTFLQTVKEDRCQAQHPEAPSSGDALRRAAAQKTPEQTIHPTISGPQEISPRPEAYIEQQAGTPASETGGRRASQPPVPEEKKPLIVGSRDIRVMGEGLDNTAQQEQAPAAAQQMPFDRHSPEELALRQEETAAGAAVPPVSQQSSTQTVNAERPLSPEYRNLLRTFHTDLTEADLRFLSENQRRQLAQSVPPALSRDIRVTGEGLDHTAQQAEAPAAARQMPFDGHPPEELALCQEETAAGAAAVLPVSQQSNTQTVNSERPLSPEYRNLLRTFHTDLTEADLQFLSENQRRQLEQSVPPALSRDIRVTGEGLDHTAQQAEAPAAAQQMPFDRHSPEELALRQEETAAGAAAVPPVSQQSNTQTVNSERPLSPEYRNLLRTFHTDLTEADLQFLSENQRRQLAQSVPPALSRDIRVTGEGLDHTAQQAEAPAAARQMPFDGHPPEELALRQEEATAANIPAVSESGRFSQKSTADHNSAAQGKRERTSASWQTKPPVGASVSPNRGRDSAPAVQPAAAAAQTGQHYPPERWSQPAAFEELNHRQAMQPMQPPNILPKAVDIRTVRQLSSQTQLHTGMPRPSRSEPVSLPSAANREERSSAPVEMHLPSAEHAIPFRTDSVSAPDTPMPVQKDVGSVPMELTYTQAAAYQPGSPPLDPESRNGQAQTSAYLNSLPGWAQSFIKNSAPSQTSGITPSTPIGGVARNISSVSSDTPGAAEQTVDWKSPKREKFMRQAAQKPAEVTFREKPVEETRQSRPAQLTESELRRTADKVYKMIEDRIRRERRLLGL